MMKIPHTKNILLKNAQANAESIFLREYFFFIPRKIVFKKFPNASKK